MQKSQFGKKVFFLYPHSVIQERLISRVLEQEYEVYMLKDHRRALKVLSVHNDAILFINIDKVLSEQEWKRYVRIIMTSEGTSEVATGIVSYNENKQLAEYYLMELMVSCGFILLKTGVEESTRIILKTLEANEARGRRRYVRARCHQTNSATFNIKIKKQIFTGSIIDISSAGMACVFDEDVELAVNTPVQDLQLRLKGIPCRLSGRVAGSSPGERTNYVIMFRPDMDQTTRDRLRNFIFSSLQEEIDRI